MQKDFDVWNKQKKKIEKRKITAYFKIGEIWWSELGLNIGVEQDGKGNDFSRPVLILKKINKHSVLCIPLSLKQESSEHILKIKTSLGTRYALIWQLRVISTKRLQEKVGWVAKQEFNTIRENTKTYL